MTPDPRPGRPLLAALAIVAMLLALVVLMAPGLSPHVSAVLHRVLLALFLVLVAVAVIRRRRRR